MRFIFNLVLLFSLFGFTLNAQYLKQKQIPVIVKGKQLKYPFAGGLNNPQVSEVDFNVDGIKDLVIFDRMGAVMLPFIFDPTLKDYVYSPQYKNFFPRVFDWALFHDFNGDGYADLFASAFTTQAIPGIEVYKAKKVENHLEWEIIKSPYSRNILYFPIGNGISQIPVDYSDIPTFDDIDYDGDTDILTYEPGSNTVTWFENISIDRGKGRDTLIYAYKDRCYGKFQESGLSSEIKLSGSIDTCASGFHSPIINSRHAGSTILSLDLDNDKDQDLLIGDLTSKNIAALYNGGNPKQAWITRKDTAWNKNDVPVNLYLFNAAFQADINHDGKQDILVASNNVGICENVNNLWLFIDEGTASTPFYEFKKNNFLADEMIDLGDGAHPCFVDYNQDGLMDLLVGIDFIYEPKTTNRPSSMMLFKNTGTKNSPIFTLVDSNYLDYKLYSSANAAYSAFSPSFGDLDSDGDLDLLVGNNQGTFFYSENIAGANKEFKFAKPIIDFQDIGIATYTNPCLVDLNRDGLMDIVAGTKLNNNSNGSACGSFYYFENTGSKTNPQFSQFGTTPCLGKALQQGLGSKVYSSPKVVDFNGKYKLFSGNLFGEIAVWDDIENNINASFRSVNPNYGQMKEGEIIHLSFADIDADGVLDMAVGNHRGGFSIYETDYNIDGSTVGITNKPKKDIGFIYQQISNSILVQSPESEKLQFQLLDLQGKLIQSGNFRTNEFVHLLSAPIGVYLIKITRGNSNSYTYKITIE